MHPSHTTREVEAATGARPAGDAVNHPSHYNSHPSGIECIEVVEHHNFNVGSAIKYLWRAGLKGGDSKSIEDLRKSAWYALREAARLGWKGDEAPSPVNEVTPKAPLQARALFFYLDLEERSLCALPFDEMPFDKGELNPNAGALVFAGIAFARNEGCARAAARNTQFYDDDTRNAFDLLGEKLEEWRKEMLHAGAYVQVRPHEKG